MKRAVLLLAVCALCFSSLPVCAEIRGYLPYYNVGTVALINTDTNTKITDFSLGGGGPLAATVSWDGTRVYFITHNANLVPSVPHAVKVIDTATNTVIGAIPLEGQPARIAVNRAGTLGYVTDQENDRVVVIDTVNFTTTGVTIPVGNYPTGIDLTPDGSTLYVANYYGGSVSVVDTATHGAYTISSIPAAFDVVVNHEGTLVYVSRSSGSDGISVIPVGTDHVYSVSAPSGVSAIAINSDDSRLYVSIGGTGIRVYDTTNITPTFVTDIPFSGGGNGVAIRPDGARVYVPDYGSQTLYVIDTASLTVTTSIPNVGSSYGAGKWIRESILVTIGLSGGGSGTVVAPDLSCAGHTCRGAYAFNSTFDITATANAETSVFSEWIGCSAPNGPVCTITTTADISMTAIFDLLQTPHVLTVTNDGAGSGSVTSDPIGINCGSDCSETYAHGQSITLTAAAESDSVFGGWSGGGCSGTDECVVSMTANINVTATFNLLNSIPELSTDKGTIGTRLTVTGSGFGSKKGKLLIGGAATKIAKGAWAPASIIGVIKKALPPGISYDVVLKAKEPKGVTPTTLPRAFTIMAPDITSVVPDSDAEGATIEISGNFFSMKKGKVYLGEKKCKVLLWEMNAASGVSRIQFIIPGKMAPGPYNLTVTNKVGSDTLANGFTIP